MRENTEEQLNRLISAYNTRENDLLFDSVDSVEANNQINEIRNFERKLKPGKISNHNKLQHHEWISTDKTSDSLKGRQKGTDNHKLFGNFTEPTSERIENIEKEMTLQQQIDELKSEELLLKNEYIENAFRTACGSNLNLIDQVKMEKTTKAILEKNIQKINEELEVLKLKSQLKSQDQIQSMEKQDELKQLIHKSEEKLVELNLKLSILEITNGKNLKLFKREFPELGRLDAIVKSDKLWKGRASEIEHIKSQIDQFKSASSAKDIDLKPNIIPKKNFVGVSEQKIQEIENQRSENESLVR